MEVHLFLVLLGSCIGCYMTAVIVSFSSISDICLTPKAVMEELLKKIENQNAEIILSEDNLSEKFNQLLKFNLITLKNGKIVLTERGKRAKEEGLHMFLKETEQTARLVDLPKKDHKKMVVLYLISFFILLLAFLLVVILHLLS